MRKTNCAFHAFEQLRFHRPEMVTLGLTALRADTAPHGRTLPLSALIFAPSGMKRHIPTS